MPERGEAEMKKVFGFIFMALAVLLLSAPLAGVAEAARVAVLPIQIDEKHVARATDFNGYYWDIMIDTLKYPEYELMDDEKVANVLPEEGLQSYAQPVLADICEKTDAEIVIVMRLDKVEENPLTFRKEPMLECVMMGEFAGYNRLTGRYYHKKMYIKEEIEEVLTVKNDWQQDMFASNLKRYIHRTLIDDNKNKKKK